MMPIPAHIQGSVWRRCQARNRPHHTMALSCAMPAVGCPTACRVRSGAPTPGVPRLRVWRPLRAVNPERSEQPETPPRGPLGEDVTKPPAHEGEMPRPLGGTAGQVVRGRPYSLYDALMFAGPAPEIINGRLAMLGFVAAMGAEMATGQGLLQQFWQAPAWVLVTLVVITAASLAPILRGTKLQESYGPWRPDAEVLNGRLAMLGMVLLVMTEAWKGGALWAR